MVNVLFPTKFKIRWSILKYKTQNKGKRPKMEEYMRLLFLSQIYSAFSSQSVQQIHIEIEWRLFFAQA